MLSVSFSTREVLRLTGATARQLQWWDEHRLIVPARKGRSRTYSQDDLSEIVVILELRRRRISLQQVRRVLRFLRKNLDVRLADLVLECGLEQDCRMLDYHLLIDGRHLYLETDTRQIFDLLHNSAQAVFVISLTDMAKRLRVSGASLTSSALESERRQPAPEKTLERAKGNLGKLSA